MFKKEEKKKKEEKHRDELSLHLEQQEDSGVSRQAGPGGSAQEALQPRALFQPTSHSCCQFATLCSLFACF